MAAAKAGEMDRDREIAATLALVGAVSRQAIAVASSLRDEVQRMREERESA